MCTVYFAYNILKKGLEAKTNLLELHRVQPILDPKEIKAFENFTGSDSWAKKFARRHQLKMTGTRIKELSEEELKEFHSSLTTMAARIKQAGPRFEDVANTLRQAGEKLLRARLATASCPTSSNSVHATNIHQSRQHPSPNETGNRPPAPSTKFTAIVSNIHSPTHSRQHILR
jgi:hypothetical protein